MLDREELCLKMQEEENAHSDRRKCLQDFFTVRQTMLAERGQSQSHGETISGSPSQDRIDSVANRLYDLVDSSVPFQFESSLPGCVDTGLEDAVSRMRECDDAMVQRVTQTFSDVNLETLKYDVESGTAGIALNKNGDAFCRVKLVLEAPAATNDGGQNEKSKTVLLSGICSAEFSSESNRLTSLKWTILEDRCTGHHQRSASVHSDTTSSERSSDTLVRQSVHPSVVSLDHARHNEADDNQQGPGMNI